MQSYGAYGIHQAQGNARTGYTGEILEREAGGHLLGGRLYDLTLRRFLKPDAASPFGGGGFNRYSYCGGDPVNRIDPSGNTWQTWLLSSLQVSAPKVGTASANRGLSQTNATNNATDALMSPVILASAESAVADVVAHAVDIGSIASTTSVAPVAGGVFGWLFLGSGPAPGDLTSLDKGGKRVGDISYRATTHTFSGGDHQIDNYRGRDALLEHVPSRLLDTDGLHVRWHTIPNANGGMNYVADSPTFAADLRPLMRLIGENSGSLDIVILDGAHGAANGINWANGRRLHVERGFYVMSDVLRTTYASLAGRSDDAVEVKNLADMTNVEFVRVSNSNAIVVHACCFGIADRELMFEHNIRQATTYQL
jgi:RHS repeat-associated protein